MTETGIITTLVDQDSARNKKILEIGMRNHQKGGVLLESFHGDLHTPTHTNP